MVFKLTSFGSGIVSLYWVENLVVTVQSRQRVSLTENNKFIITL